MEDAISNRESVIVGFDTAATEDIDEHLGAMEPLTPFDSVLEVKVGTLLGGYHDRL